MLNGSQHPDLQLVRSAVSGDRAAARSLIQRLAPAVRSRVVWLLLRNRAIHAQIPQEADDLTQEVFVALFSRGGRDLLSWEPERGMSLEGFIGLVAKRRVISILRTRRLNPFETPPAPADDEQPEPATAVDQTLIERQQLHELDHMLRARLSELGLEMFYRLYVWEQELDLIAAETGLSKAAVYQWRSRLRTQLRQIVEERQERDQGPRPGAD